MNIVVCVKRTPSSTSVALDANGALQTAGVPHAINPFDEYAVEEAIRVKEKFPGSKVTVLSAGAPESEEVIRSAIALGCDEGVVLSDPAFDGSDSLAVSAILAKAIEKIGSVSLVFFGKQTNDGESGHMSALVAARLKCPSAASVRKIPSISESAVSVERLMDEGVDTLSLSLPAVIGVTKEINEPRLPSLKGKMAAKKAPVLKWGAADLGADLSVLGKSSATAVAKLEPVPARGAGIVIEGDSPELQAKNLVAKLKETKFI